MEQLERAQSLLESRVARLYARYAEAVDAGDIEALRKQVTDDVAITRPGGEAAGVEAFLDVYRQVVAQGVPLTQHSVTNIVAEQDGEVVQARAYFRAMFFEAESTRVVVGRYVDDLVEVADELRFAHKRNHVQRVVTLPAATVVGA
ncbi:nuclear transport factor 2 family protein [Nocardioides sp. SYSU DS0663]|uniref:nuclear transport factor 2 family protein n=1 Tax=Nocardioides sp. SYSU DS0663 TaxID=3416445 RepID=UPI003F4B8AE7